MVNPFSMRAKPIYLGESKKMLLAYLSSVEIIDAFEYYGEIVDSKVLQVDIRFLVDEFCIRKDEMLKWFVHNSVAIIIENYGVGGTIEDRAHSMVNLVEASRHLQLAHAKSPKVIKAIHRLGEGALLSYERNVNYEEILLRVAKIGIK